MNLPLMCSAAILALAVPASADVSVRFVEGAPTDRFVFEMSGSCPIGEAELALDLTGSSAGLVFDVTDAGAGVEVFQPFILVTGAELVRAHSDVSDGDTALSLHVPAFAPGQRIAFTIDVDDTIGAREITVSGAEITGAQAALILDGQRHVAAFGPDARALISHDGCTS